MNRTIYIETFKRARRVGVPFIAIETADQLATIATLAAAGNGSTAVIQWDTVRGPLAFNEHGAESLTRLISSDDPKMFGEPIIWLERVRVRADSVPEGTIIIMMGTHRDIEHPTFAQALLNLRDVAKQRGLTIVLLGPAFTFAAEIQHDIILLREPLPDEQELSTVLGEIVKSANIPAPKDGDAFVSAVTGLSRFEAEQVLALSCSKTGIEVHAAWRHKKASVDQMPGLKLTSQGPTFEDVGGLDGARRFAERLCDSSNESAPGVIVRIDEIEKAMAGIAGDTSGVSQDLLGALLRWMEDGGHSGMIAVGPPGSGKSLYSKVMGSTFGIPTCEVDMGAWRGSLVGESERKCRQALRVIDGIASRGRVFVVATCNKLDVLPPELRRRFKARVWFFDLPTGEEKTTIWNIQIAEHGLDPTVRDRPADEGWSGADIRDCCELASMLDCPLLEAARYIVPITLSDPETLERLRTAAQNRFISAATGRAYKRNADMPFAKGGRSMDIN